VTENSTAGLSAGAVLEAVLAALRANREKLTKSIEASETRINSLAKLTVTKEHRE
jgi:hypothetical protein